MKSKTASHAPTLDDTLTAEYLETLTRQELNDLLARLRQEVVDTLQKSSDATAIYFIKN